MKKIGEGWQYSAYDLNNGRILKKFHSWPKAYWVIFKTIFPFRDDSVLKIPSFIKGMKDKANISFEILKKSNIPEEWLANPEFINKYDFEQDKVQPLHELFEKLNTQEIKEIINQFVEFNKKLLALGVIDKSFNITKNYGLNNKNKIVLIDIGELFNDPIQIKSQKETRAWAKSYVAGYIKDEGAREYFIQEMDKNFGLLSR